MLGQRIGSWILERELGRGGMGCVYEARHASLRTRAAVKVLSPGIESEELFRQRFQREAELQAQLRHPNISRVLDYLEDHGRWFLVVEYLDRGSLADVLSREKISHEQAIAWTKQALAGLGYAHGKGIVHRDVKPPNLLLAETGEIAVADFGIARSDAAPGLTTTGVVVGTPQYMSPEQILTPDRVDHRSDIYSLGVVLYELLAGRKPFDSGSQFAILQAHVSEPPPALRTIDPTIPPAVEAVVMRALAKKAADRYPDCEAMRRDLDHAAEARASNAPSAAIGATMHAADLFERVSEPASASAGDVRNRKRRRYQRRLAGGIAATLAVAVLFAMNAAEEEPAAEDRPPVVVSTAPPPPVSSPVEPPHQNTTQGSPNAVTKAATLRQPAVPHQPVAPPETNRLAPDATPPPTPLPSPAMPRLPERPRVAVIGAGDDPLLAGALEQEMERRLDRFDVADEHGDPEVSQLLESKGKDVAFKDLGAVLLKGGFQVLVLLRVEKAESRTVSVRGIDGSIKAARMRLNAYLLPANRSVGNGWTEPAEYTELSTVTTARRAFIGPTADLRSAIDAEWARLRGAGDPAGGDTAP